MAVNPILLKILRKKITAGEITVAEVKLQEYINALNE